MTISIYIILNPIVFNFPIKKLLTELLIVGYQRFSFFNLHTTQIKDVQTTISEVLLLSD